MDEEDLSRLHQWVNSRLGEGVIAVITHKNGDMDTVSSAIVLSELLGEKVKACGIHLSKMAKKMVDIHGGSFTKMDQKNTLWPRTLSGVIVVDCASVEQSGLTIPRGVPICVIDHHSGGSEWGEADLGIQWPMSSTAEIVYAYAAEFHSAHMTRDSAALLLAGIITDTGRFKHGDFNSLKTAAAIVEKFDLSLSQFIEEMESGELNTSQRHSIAKALARCEAIDAGEWYLLHTRGSTCEGVVAHALLAAGAEVSLVTRRAKDETRLIARATHKAVNQGLHLGDLLSSLRDTLGGEGGGHAGAAGWSGDVPPITATSAFIASLSSTRRDGR